ncbi:MAG: hypothetical protein HYT94_02240 [Parcubacteria group bacterium]|nr:hypothetical protein [Parcubacteria group bacterium]
MHFQSLFLYYLTVWKPLGYVLASLGMVFEGDGVLFTVAFLTSEGFFDPGDMLLVVFFSYAVVLRGKKLYHVFSSRYEVGGSFCQAI